MADVFTRQQRSKIMAAVRSRGNKDTELRLAAILRTARITGWRRHQKLPGNPDFVFRKEKVAVFVDGCFWHGCRRHLRMPNSNVQYWRSKISRNRSRDTRTNEILKSRGWTVIRIWEHDLTKPRRIEKAISGALRRNHSLAKVDSRMQKSSHEQIKN